MEQTGLFQPDLRLFCMGIRILFIARSGRGINDLDHSDTTTRCLTHVVFEEDKSQPNI
jgi:hypothetical protein